MRNIQYKFCSCCLASPIYSHTELLSLRDLFLVSRETVIIAPIPPSLSCLSSSLHFLNLFLVVKKAAIIKYFPSFSCHRSANKLEVTGPLDI